MNPQDHQGGRWESVSDRTNSSVRRRSVLAALGAGAVGATGFLPTARADSATPVTVPEFLRGRSVVREMEVPERWLSHRNFARSAKRNLAKRIRGREGVFSVGLVGHSDTYGGKPGLQIQVRVANESAARTVPDAVEGIPIRVEPAPPAHGPGTAPDGECLNSEAEPVAAGGEAVGWYRNGYGTATATVRNEDRGERQLLHCGHVFYQQCPGPDEDGVVGRPAARGVWDDEHVRIGTVTEWDRKGDYVLIAGNDDSRFVQRIEDGETDPTIEGCVSAAKLDSLVASNETPTIRKVGVTTGVTTGEILSTGVSLTLLDACYDFRGHGVEASTNFADGDSGGPVYLTRDGGSEAYLSHIASYRYWDRAPIETCHSNVVQRGNAVGTAAYYVEDNEPVTFG